MKNISAPNLPRSVITFSFLPDVIVSLLIPLKESDKDA